MNRISVNGLRLHASGAVKSGTAVRPFVQHPVVKLLNTLCMLTALTLAGCDTGNTDDSNTNINNNRTYAKAL
jgi:hypothetical protein